MISHLDLFSGIGGFSLAAKWAGFETVQFVENDKFCQKVLAKNFPGVPIHDDIKTFNYAAPVTLLTGGFPCQPFSSAGKNKGILDDRYLWPEMFRIIRECKPSWIIAENVFGILPRLDPIFENLESENYTWEAFIIPASAVLAPHKRERLWIIANCDSERLYERRGDWKERYIQANRELYLATIQSKWSQFQPKSWTTFIAQDWLNTIPHAISIKSSGENKTVRQEKSEQRFIFSGEDSGDSASIEWRENQPPIPGVDDGLSKRLDITSRNKALGNAIVPQVIYPIMKFIFDLESSNATRI